MSRLSLIIAAGLLAGVTSTLGCVDPQTDQRFVALETQSAPAPPVAEPAQYIPPDVRNITIDCGTSVNVGFEENPRIIMYTSAPNADKEAARAECMAAVDWSPYTYWCKSTTCHPHGGCETSVDAESYTELQACRCYSPEAGTWLCQKWALLSPGQSISCSACNPPPKK